MSKSISAAFSIVSMSFVYTWMLFTFLQGFEFLVPPEIAIAYRLRTTVISQMAFIFGEILLNYGNHSILTAAMWFATSFIVGFNLENKSQVFLTAFFALFFVGFFHTLIVFTDVYLNIPEVFRSPEKILNIAMMIINDVRPILIPHFIIITIGSGFGFGLSEKLLAIEEETEESEITLS